MHERLLPERGALRASAAASRLAALGALLAVACSASGCCEFSGPKYHGRKSDHFDGKTFHNEIEQPVPASAFARWAATRKRGAWTWQLDAPPGPPPPTRVADGALRVTWVNHATVLIQVDGINILTDPIWGDVAGPVSYAGSHRRHSPGLRFEDLPPIDLVLLSHDHYDHMDLPTLHRLQAAHHPVIAAGLGQRAVLREFGVRDVVELDWGSKLHFKKNKLVIVGVPARHGCMRGLCDRDATLWLGFVILSRGGNLYFAGDTGWGPHLQRIGERYGPFRLAMLPIAPARPRELFAPVHIDAEEAVRAARVLRAQQSLAIHFGTFAQGDDGEVEPVERLHEALQRAPGVEFRVPRFGEGWDVPALGAAPAAASPPAGATSSPAAGGS
jgi:L-ascorbate metabolism protein UlaG (beta-lactamase superfamily)